MDITSQKRSKIVALNPHTFITQRDITNICKVSLLTTNNILKCYNETESMEPNKDKNAVVSVKRPAEMTILLRKFKENPLLIKSAKRFGESWFPCTLFCCMSKLHAVRKIVRPQKKQILTAQMKQ